MQAAHRCLRRHHQQARAELLPPQALQLLSPEALLKVGSRGRPGFPHVHSNDCACVRSRCPVRVSLNFTEMTKAADDGKILEVPGKDRNQTLPNLSSLVVLLCRHAGKDGIVTCSETVCHGDGDV